MTNAIAIDGPAGAGKSTIAKKISKEKGVVYVDTGAMYRAMGLYYLRKGIAPTDSKAMEAELDNIHVTIKFEDGQQVVYLNDENVNGLIRTQEIGNMASQVSVNKYVREKMVSLQQALVREQPVVMDGRDIGTVVIPDARVKIYLTASVEVRAQRRYDEYLEKGQEADLEQLKVEIAERDQRDMNRENSPLKKAEDAVEVDSSYMTIDEVVKAILDISEEKGL